MCKSKIAAVLLFQYLTIAVSGCSMAPAASKQAALDLLGTGNTLAAINTVTAVIKENPKDADAISLRAALYDIEHEDAKANEDCATALSLSPSDSKVYVICGLIKLRKDLSGASIAVPEFDKAIARDPKSPWPFLSRVIAKYKLGDTNGASSDVQQAVALGNSNELAFGALSRELSLLGFREQAKIFNKQEKSTSQKKLAQLTSFIQQPVGQTPPVPPMAKDDFVIAMVVAQRLQTLDSMRLNLRAERDAAEQRRMQVEAEQLNAQAQQDARDMMNDIEQRKQQRQSALEAERRQQMQNGALQLQEELRQKQSY